MSVSSWWLAFAAASSAGWIQAVVGPGERASPGWCDRGRVRAGRPGVVGGAVGLRALGYVRGRPEGGCRVPVGLASAVKQPVRVVDVLVLIGGKGAGRRECGAGI